MPLDPPASGMSPLGDSGGQATPPGSPGLDLTSLADSSGQPPPRGSPDFGMTPVGEYCRIWDPEQHEPSALAFLRELDARLFASDLPHVWDVLGLEPLAKPVLSRLEPSGDAEDSASQSESG